MHPDGLDTSGESSSHFHPLSRDRCQELLAAHSTGRVAWNAADGPMVLPVSYAMYLGDVVFRTAPNGALSALTTPTNVAFEIDEVDHEAGTGWSVLVRGRAAAIKHPFDVTTLSRMQNIEPWAPGARHVYIAIAARTITGRAVKAPFAE